MNVIGIILARTDSSRLPQKALLKINNLCLIEYVIKRALNIKGLEKIVLATTKRNIDDPLCQIFDSYRLDTFRGSTDNVASRILECTKIHRATHFIRLNGDSPFLDCELISDAIPLCADEQLDMVSNLIDRTFPYGISVEIIKTNTFEMAQKGYDSDAYREHPTKYFYDNLTKFKVKMISSKKPHLKNAKIVVDTPDDLRIFTKAVSVFKKNVFTVKYDKVARWYIKENPKV